MRATSAVASGGGGAINARTRRPRRIRFGRQIGAHQRGAARRRIPFVEDQVDHGQDRVEPRRHVVGVRHRIRNPGGANLSLGPHQSLRHRRRRDEEGARDLVGVEAAERPERQGDLRVERNRGMAAGKDQAKAIVGDLAGVVVGLLDGPVEP
jgi:hypothetical protein